MKKYLVFTLLGLALVGGYFFLNKKQPNPVVSETPQATPREVNIKASFEIYTKGTRRIFTASMYHNLSMDVFIEATAPNTVNVKKEGVTWADFFKTLPMELTKDCLVTGTKQTFCTGEGGTLKFYINDSEDENALGREIKEGDRLLVKFDN